jgi:exodeoxyribonuclease VII small subunit
MSKPISKMKFEESLEKLEKIIAYLDKGEMDLEKAIEYYDEGLKLQKHCEMKLKNASLRVEKIVQNNGVVQLDKF